LEIIATVVPSFITTEPNLITLREGLEES